MLTIPWNKSVGISNGVQKRVIETFPDGKVPLMLVCAHLHRLVESVWEYMDMNHLFDLELQCRITVSPQLSDRIQPLDFSTASNNPQM